ncbi:GIY-YIG nuclease family protein [Pseudobacillus sp. 179-B 2D1 NHS]|uniref:GIY-YIG nuclease family protein n=1 Tax=Pseudobacillus sp. 179-B 2D1 NHS TaxID=3374292 RepID=UPI003879BE89
MSRNYTHSKGFNITSLNGVYGIYLFRNIEGDVTYIGMCNNDFKNRLNSHAYGSHGKLAPNVQFLQVIIADPNKHPLHVLEHLLIWYLRPSKNYALWLFAGAKDEKSVKTIAKARNLHIRHSIENFLLSFDSVIIEREWEDDSRFKRYGETESLNSRRIDCSGEDNCLCFKCLVVKRRRWLKTKGDSI